MPVQVQKNILAPNPTMSVGSDASGINAMEAQLWKELRARIASNYPVAQWPVEVVELMKSYWSRRSISAVGWERGGKTDSQPIQKGGEQGRTILALTWTVVEIVICAAMHIADICSECTYSACVGPCNNDLSITIQCH